MPNIDDRPSLNNGLLEKYYTEHVGGAFDAKKPTPDIFGIQEKYWTIPGFVSWECLGYGENLGNGGSKKIEDSTYRQGYGKKPPLTTITNNKTDKSTMRVGFINTKYKS